MFRRTGRQEDVSVQKDRWTGVHRCTEGQEDRRTQVYTEGQVDRRTQVYRRTSRQENTTICTEGQVDGRQQIGRQEDLVY
jgi:hypothetical protein